MTDTQPDYAFDSELVVKSRHYPTHLQVTKGARNVDTGQWVNIFDWEATRAHIECLMRMAHAKGENHFEAVYNSKPIPHAHGTTDASSLITEAQGEELLGLINAAQIDEADFLKYMKVDSLLNIPAKDYKKAINAIEVIIKKAQK